MDVETPEPETVAPSDKPPEALHHRDLAFIQQQRSRLRLFDPAGVYYFRHVAPTWFHSCLHFVSLLFSSILILCLSIYGHRLAVVDIAGIGTVSELTLSDYLTDICVVVIVILGIKALHGQLTLVPIQRYGLSMLANASNAVLLKFVQLSILMLAFVLVPYLLVTGDVALEQLNHWDGIGSDIGNVISGLITVIIFYTTFRHCHKELAE